MAEKNKTMVPLGLVTEAIATYRLVQKFSPLWLRGGVHPQFVAEFVHQTAKHKARKDQFIASFDKEVEEAIPLASLLAAIGDELSDTAVNRRINLVYAYYRFIYFEIPSPIDPRRSPDSKKLSTDENDRLMDLVWETLDHTATVQEEIERQRQANRLTHWRHERRSKAIEAYAKMKDRLPGKIQKYRDSLQEELLSERDSKNPVKPTNENPSAKNSVSQEEKVGSSASFSSDLAEEATKPE